MWKILLLGSFQIRFEMMSSNWKKKLFYRLIAYVVIVSCELILPHPLPLVFLPLVRASPVVLFCFFIFSANNIYFNLRNKFQFQFPDQI